MLAEYDVLAREAQTDRWATLLDVAPFPENVADVVFTSPYYERLEAAGHITTVALSALAPRLTPGGDQADPAAQLGPPSSRPERRERWEAHTATVALYRHRYDITGASPLGDPNAVRGPDHAAEYRGGRFALRHIKASVRHDDDRGPQPTDRSAPRRGL